MKRFDLRHLKQDIESRMQELINSDLADDEVGIFLFEIGDFSLVQKTSNLIKSMGFTMMNSLKFNEVDWTIVMKKTRAN